MTITLTLTGAAPSAVRTQAAELLEALTGEVPLEQPFAAADDNRRDLTLGVAIAALVLAVPGAVLATLDIAERLRKRRTLAPKVEAVKQVLEQTNAEGTIRYEKTVIHLNGLSTDQILDRLLDNRHQ